MKHILCRFCKAKIGVTERVDTIIYTYRNGIYHIVCWRCHRTLRKEK